MFGRGRGYPRAPLPEYEPLLLVGLEMYIGLLDNSWLGGKVYNYTGLGMWSDTDAAFSYSFYVYICNE